jgi:hypothetical protein
MADFTIWAPLKALTVATCLVISGCASAPEEAETKQKVAQIDKRCEGSEWVDNSSVAVLPVPVVAFFVPHADTNDIEEHKYVSRCGEKSRLKNEEVVVSKAACVPAGLTRIITLGVWQWCPAHVSWEADIH